MKNNELEVLKDSKSIRCPRCENTSDGYENFKEAYLETNEAYVATCPECKYDYIVDVVATYEFTSPKISTKNEHLSWRMAKAKRLLEVNKEVQRLQDLQIKELKMKLDKQ